jgi:hypothetical protein
VGVMPLFNKISDGVFLKYFGTSKEETLHEGNIYEKIRCAHEKKNRGRDHTGIELRKLVKNSSKMAVQIYRELCGCAKNAFCSQNRERLVVLKLNYY